MVLFKPLRVDSPQSRNFIEPAGRRNVAPWMLTFLNAVFAALTVYFSLGHDAQCPEALPDKRYRNAELNKVLKATSTYCEHLLGPIHLR